MRKIAIIATAVAAGAAVLVSGLTSADSAVRSTSGDFRACLKTTSHELTKVTYRTKLGRCGKGQRAVAWNARGATGAKGATGPRGAAGTRGATGPMGPSAVYSTKTKEIRFDGLRSKEILSKTVPAGTYAVNAKLFTYNLEGAGDDTLYCILRAADGGYIDTSGSYKLGPGQGATIALQGVVTTAAGTLDVTCQQYGTVTDTRIYDASLQAIKVGASG